MSPRAAEKLALAINELISCHIQYHEEKKDADDDWYKFLQGSIDGAIEDLKHTLIIEEL